MFNPEYHFMTFTLFSISKEIAAVSPT